MHLQKIHQIAVHSRDLDETIRFYRDTLGARFLARFDPPGLVFFDFTGTRVLFEKNASRAILYYWVDDIDAAFDELVAKGIEFQSKPHAIHRDDAGTFGPRGAAEWMAFFKDPSENVVALASQRMPR